MCSSNKVSEINVLHDAENCNATVTLRFGKYMNRGSWNFNTGRVDSIIRGLNKALVSVQCEMITELSHEAWESRRDSVEVVSSDGTQLAYHPDMQHNKNLSDLRANCRKIVADTMQALQLGGGGGRDGGGGGAADDGSESSSPSSESETKASESEESGDDDAAKGGRAASLPEELKNRTGTVVTLAEAVKLLRGYYSSKFPGNGEGATQ
jgi:hypothetical protein